ncbi:MAG: hypothetical protein LAO06_16530 [Acidobacteriia bacterium]|nr:hypothetical protein [Terriglobia bacterium]
MKSQLHLALAAVLCLAACGTPGAPRPPSLELPQPVNDLAATRQGDRVTLTWTAPHETTEKQNVRHPGPARVCRGANAIAMVQCPQVAELPPAGAPPSKNAKPEWRTYTETLPPQLQRQNPTGFATYAVEALNARGRSAGLSNQVEVPLAPTVPPPDKPTGRVTADAIEVSAAGVDREPRPLPAGLNFELHLYRRTEGSDAAADLGAPSALTHSGTNYFAQFVDRSFEWEKTYFYHVTAITTVLIPDKPPVQVSGDPSREIKVFTKDVFPPAAPSGLQAVASGVGQPPFVDLTWAPNTEPDLAGYNLYRHEAGQPPVKINTELVKIPAHRDRAAMSGRKYIYSVTAVDLRGNESPPSSETFESVP